MKVILFIQSNKYGTSRDAIKATDELNLYTILLTNNIKQIKQRDEYKDVHEMVYIKDLNYKNISSYIKNDMDKNYEIQNILSFIDDFTLIASRLRDKFVSYQPDLRTLEIIKDNILTKIKLKKYDILPNYKRIYLSESNPTLNYPLILRKQNVKGALYINSAEDIPKDYYNSHDIILEEYIDGKEYLFEILVNKNTLVSIFKFNKKTEINNNSFLTLEYSIINDISKEEIEIVNKVIKELNLSQGIFHIKIKGNKLIDIDTNISHECINDIISSSINKNYIKEVIKLYLNKEYDIPQIKNVIYLKNIVSSSQGELIKITGRNKALKVENINKIHINVKKREYINYKSITGYIVSTGDNLLEAKNSALKALERITFYVNEGLQC